MKNCRNLFSKQFYPSRLFYFTLFLSNRFSISYNLIDVIREIFYYKKIQKGWSWRFSDIYFKDVGVSPPSKLTYKKDINKNKPTSKNPEFISCSQLFCQKQNSKVLEKVEV